MLKYHCQHRTEYLTNCYYHTRILHMKSTHTKIKKLLEQVTIATKCFVYCPKLTPHLPGDPETHHTKHHCLTFLHQMSESESS